MKARESIDSFIDCVSRIIDLEKDIKKDLNLNRLVEARLRLKKLARVNKKWLMVEDLSI